MGPYLANPKDQCPICLDCSINVRTYCGHFFHSSCLKAWFDKKLTDGRPSSCPVCVGSETNPIKIYCKTCFVAAKLDTIFCSSNFEKIEQIN